MLTATTADEPVELGQVEDKPRVRFVFADRVASWSRWGKHSTKDREAYWAHVQDLQAGAVALVGASPASGEALASVGLPE